MLPSSTRQTLKQFEDEWKHILKRSVTNISKQKYEESSAAQHQNDLSYDTTDRYHPYQNSVGTSIVNTANTTHIKQDESNIFSSSLEVSPSVSARFDCSDLIIPPTYDIVDDIANNVVEKWKELDERKIRSNDLVTFESFNKHNDNYSDNDDEDSDNDNECNTSDVGTKKRRRNQAMSNKNNNIIKKMRQQEQKLSKTNYILPYDRYHLRLPYGFDYSTKLLAEPSSDDEIAIGNCDRIVSMNDPNYMPLYSKELWKFFQSIPTVVNDIESQFIVSKTVVDDNYDDDNNKYIHVNKKEAGNGSSQTNCGLKNTINVVKEIIIETRNHKRLDGHALSRLRCNDRHDYPSFTPNYMNSNISTNVNSNTCLRLSSSDESQRNSTGTPAYFEFTATLRFEFLRQQVRRGSSPDPHRMVLEFAGYQTLLDVHSAIVDMTCDEIWDEMTDQNDAETCNTPKSASSDSGYFFIEDTFYIHGVVDYVTPIFNWLYATDIKVSKSVMDVRTKRAVNLGLNPKDIVNYILSVRIGTTPGSTTKTTAPIVSPAHGIVAPPTEQFPYPFVKKMCDCKLYDLDCRLGIRYVHVMHGDVEIAVFATDRRLIPTRKHGVDDDPISFPLIHDIWTPSYIVPMCDVCQNRPAAIATATDSGIEDANLMIDRDTTTYPSSTSGIFGHHVLCEGCCRQLGLPVKQPNKLQKYTTWRGQSELSATCFEGSTF